VTDRQWQLLVASSAERSLNRLPAKVAAAVVEFMIGPLVKEPRRAGHPLQRELTGLWSARRGAYRIIYEIDDQPETVTVLRIEHRADVYRNR
jgi:mRNA interferase RelE/StbE